MFHDVALHDVIGGHKAYIHRQSVREESAVRIKMVSGPVG